jgi:hypothetical protein
MRANSTLVCYLLFNCFLSKPWIRIRIHLQCWIQIRIHNTTNLKSGLLLGGGEGGLKGEQAVLLAEGRLLLAALCQDKDKGKCDLGLPFALDLFLRCYTAFL